MPFMRPAASSLVIVDGGLASLIACAAAREGSIVAAGGGTPRIQNIAFLSPRFGPDAGLNSQPRDAAAARHAEMFGLRLTRADAAKAGDPGEHDSLVLLRAAHEARRNGCEAVIWPVQCAAGNEIDLEAAARASDRALLVARLADLDADGGPAPRIETPYADLTDQQIADLVLDMDLPAEACWWWRPDYIKRVLVSEKAEMPGGLVREPERAEVYAECLRWAPTLRAAGCLNLAV